MQVPRSALGKTGLCPACSRAIPIRTDNTEPAPLTGAFSPFSNATPQPPTPPGPVEDDKRRFGEAVDLYFARRYAEALAVFNSLATRFPDSPEVEMGRSLCLKALQTRPAFALEDKRAQSDAGQLTEDLIKKLLVHLMVNASSEEVQLKAAELACRMLGILQNGNNHLPSNSTSNSLLDELQQIHATVETILQQKDNAETKEARVPDELQP